MNRLVRNRKTSVLYTLATLLLVQEIYVFRLQKPLSKQGHRDTVVLFKRDWSHLFLFNDLMLLGALVTIPMPFNDPGSRVKKRGDQYITFHSLSFYR
jgi:hypothetical protein